jgi:hypothetical protein
MLNKSFIHSFIQSPVLKEFLLQYTAVFAKDANDIGRTHITCHKIDTVGPPFKLSPYKVPYYKMEEIRKEVSSMLQQGITKKSSSP